MSVQFTHFLPPKPVRQTLLLSLFYSQGKQVTGRLNRCPGSLPSPTPTPTASDPQQSTVGSPAGICRRRLVWKLGEREKTMKEFAKDASLSPAADPVGATGEGREQEESKWSGLGSR